MRRLVIGALLVPLSGCPSEPPPPCTSDVDLTCAPLYVPTFDNVYDNTLRTDCGSERSACHSAAGRAGGLSFESPEIAHAGLLDGRVTPNDPACSEMIVRTITAGTDYQMPVGDPLSAAERCALVQWVAAGAPGPGEPLPATSGAR